MAEEPITLYGTPLSLYTGKARSYLIKNGLAYREVTPTTSRFLQHVATRAGGISMPTIETADGSRHECKVFAKLQYGGDGLFKVIETLYNPNHFDRTIESWKAAELAHDERRERRAKRLAEREATARAMMPDD